MKGLVTLQVLLCGEAGLTLDEAIKEAGCAMKDCETEATQRVKTDSVACWLGACEQHKDVISQYLDGVGNGNDSHR